MSLLTQPRIRPATYADLEALPGDTKGEIIEDILYTQPRPRLRHSRAGLRIGGRISEAYDLEPSNPSGWWIAIEPGIELPRSAEVAPDLAGWRRERLKPPPRNEPIRVVPDWICEVLSPSNRSYDRQIKFPYYARIGVAHLWVIDTDAHTVEIKQLVNHEWKDTCVFADAEVLSAEPFKELLIPLASLWLPSS